MADFCCVKRVPSQRH